jgi:tRNA modification GTPase
MEKVFSSAWSSDLVDGADTIVARATPAGRSGLAVIRVSGSAARRVAASLCPDVDLGAGWRASLVTLQDSDGTDIDRAVVLPYSSPRSYTGEDMLEIMVHGSPWVVRTVCDAVVAAGARPAAPGEFTRRAVANGKLDLVQAEAVNDLTAAETAWQARLARAQVDGVLSAEFASLRDALVDLLAHIEASLDFSQHEIPFDTETAAAGLDLCLTRAEQLLATAGAGRRVRDGVRMVIVGPPNSGKSTLFNLLVGSERAIVSPHPGTTRDVVEAEIEVAGVPVRLQDTAGLGSSTDPVEREGVRRARGAVAVAEAVLLLWPVDGERTEPSSFAEQLPVIRLRSKADLGSESAPDGWLAVSCRTGGGIDELRSAMAGMVARGLDDLGGEVAITQRHRLALERAISELSGAPMDAPELAAEAVRSALDVIRELTGEVVTEDVLDRVFATFCIGK